MGSMTDQPDIKVAPNRYFLVFFQAGSRRDPLGYMNRFSFAVAQKLLEAAIPAGSDPENTEIDVWIESGGGEASVAYKLVLLLRNFARTVRIVVPDYAKSAATLLAIGADSIWMMPAAELGPLDVQIAHPDRENVTVSGLDVSRAMGFLADFAVDYVIVGGGSVFESTELTRIEILREFSRFAARFFEPMVAKLDPQLIHKAANDLDVAKQYAERILDLRNLPQDHPANLHDNEGIAEHLVKHYPAHEFLISRDEARRLGLPICNGEDYDKLSSLQRLHHEFRVGDLSDGRGWIRVFPEGKLDDTINRLTGEQDDEDEDEGAESTENESELPENGEQTNSSLQV